MPCACGRSSDGGRNREQMLALSARMRKLSSKRSSRDQGPAPPTSTRSGRRRVQSEHLGAKQTNAHPPSTTVSRKAYATHEQGAHTLASLMHAQRLQHKRTAHKTHRGHVLPESAFAAPHATSVVRETFPTTFAPVGPIQNPNLRQRAPQSHTPIQLPPTNRVSFIPPPPTHTRIGRHDPPSPPGAAPQSMVAASRVYNNVAHVKRVGAIDALALANMGARAGDGGGVGVRGAGRVVTSRFEPPEHPNVLRDRKRAATIGKGCTSTTVACPHCGQTFTTSQ